MLLILTSTVLLLSVILALIIINYANIPSLKYSF